MPIYTTVMLVLAAALVLAGLLLHCGQTGWLYSFNRSEVRDKAAYARYLGKSVASMGLMTLLDGLVYLLGGPIPAVVLLIVGFVAAMVIIAKGASKYY